MSWFFNIILPALTGAAVAHFAFRSGYNQARKHAWKMGVLEGYAATWFPKDEKWKEARDYIDTLRVGDGLPTIEEEYDQQLQSSTPHRISSWNGYQSN